MRNFSFIIRVEKPKKSKKAKNTEKGVLEIYAQELYPTARATTILTIFKRQHQSRL